MNTNLRIVCVILFFLSNILLAGESAIFEFQDPVLEERFQNLSRELRCLVCQNQNLADSHADLAGDLRKEIYELLTKGKSDQEIVDFLVQRYGDFIRYRPPVNLSTYLLWFSPIILVLIAGVIFTRSMLSRNRQIQISLSDAERQRIRRLIDDDSQQQSDSSLKPGQ